MRLLGPSTLTFLATAGACLLALYGGCNTYDESLLGTGGSDAATTSSSGKGGQNEGGEAPCGDPSDCPGADTECGAKTCVEGFCGVDAVPAGTPTSNQTAGDCETQVCDGNGGTDVMADDTDVADDLEDCTTDSCSGGQPSHVPVGEGTACVGSGNAKVCNAAGACVECVAGSDCASGSCTQSFTCAPASCNDNMQNNGETDVDCGGTMCPGCLEGEMCIDGGDCIGDICTGGICQPSCTDMVENGTETDVDCGGSCPACAVGQGCSVASDCVSGTCSGTCGEYQLLISEFRGRGPGQGTDDFLEIYNPLPVPVTLPLDTPANMGEVEAVSRSDSGMSYSVKWTANGETIPAHGHYLIVGGGYSGATAFDAQPSAVNGLLTDKVSVVLRRGTTVLDAACLYCGTNPFDATYTCEGTPLPVSGCTGTAWGDKSLERKPGAAAGNGQDTGDTTNDFNVLTPSAPQNLASPPTP